MHCSIIWHILGNDLKIFSYSLQIGQIMSGTEKENHVLFAQLCKEKLDKNPNFLQRIVFSKYYSFLLYGVVNKRNYKIRAPNARIMSMRDRRASNVHDLVRYLQNLGNSALFSWWGDYYRRHIEKDIRVLSFPNLANYPSDIIFDLMGLLRSFQFRSDKNWATDFQACRRKGVARSRGLHGLLTWPTWLLSLSAVF